MRLVPWACGLSALVAVAEAALFARNSPVLHLTPDNFDKEVLEVHKPALVAFTAPWCGYCRNLAPSFERVAAELESGRLVLLDGGRVAATGPAEAILPDTESGLEKWLEINSTYSAEGPNIPSRRDPPADADAAGQMHILADLGAGADGRPGVHHRAFADPGAEIDEGRHQHRAGRHIG